MQGFLRLFPLNWVIFPNELINLHIFEPRYKQLIAECEETGDPFGVPFFNGGLQPFGTLVQLVEIRKKYSDGKLDIVAEGIEPFEILQFKPIVESKLYPGGKVKTRIVNYDFDPLEADRLLHLADQFFDLIGTRPKDLKLDPHQISFSIGHKIGLEPEKELELILLADEGSRQEFLMEHLELMIPTLKKANNAKKRIQLNGYFKNFDPLQF